MTRLVLFSSENISKAKQEIVPLLKSFLQVEPRNTLVIPETKQGHTIINQAFAKLETIGYSPEDAQLIMSEVVEKLLAGEDPAAGGGAAPQHF